MTAVKICCIQDRGEAALALEAGADVLGFVGEQPAGPGRIDMDTIVELIAWVDGRAACWLLTSTTSAEGLIAEIGRARPSAVQICDTVELPVYAALRAAHPDVQLVQVVHVSGPDALQEALRVRPHVDALLLDSGVQKGPNRQLGGTGKTHDWSVSQRIVAEVEGPVWLAGGLHAGNVGVAMATVRPHGVDLCSGVRDAAYALEPARLDRYMAAVRAADGPLDLPAGADLAALQRYVHALEAQHGWLDADLVQNCFLMVEEVGELHAAVRRLQRAEARGEDLRRLKREVGDEVVDVLNYLLALANRLDIDLESAFRAKNALNQGRTWD